MRNNLKKRRRSHDDNLTQKQLADAIGVSTVTIYKIESQMGCNIETALKLARFFGTTVEGIFELENE